MAVQIRSVTPDDWERNEGDTLTLAVHEDNARAIAFYERCGFIATGDTEEYRSRPTARSSSCAKPCRSVSPSR